MNTIRSTSQSDLIPAHLHLTLVPAACCPATVVCRRQHELTDGDCVEEVFEFILSSEPSDPLARKSFESAGGRVFANFSGFSQELELWQQLAAGESIEIPHHLLVNRVFGDEKGTVSLFWLVAIGGEPGMVSPKPVLDFLPPSTFSNDLTIWDWAMERFPGSDFRGVDTDSEAIALFLYLRWIEEVQPERNHESHRQILHTAVFQNFEYLVSAVLHQVGQIDEGPVAQVTETALGIAMENAGDFSRASDILPGHRKFRDQPNEWVEGVENWVARARRIETILRAAGAIDYSPLFEACRNGDLATVRRLLDEGFPPNFTGYGYGSALFEALEGKHVEICKLLLARGANANQAIRIINSTSRFAEIYPLELAIDRPGLAAALLDGGAIPNPWNFDEVPIIFRRSFGSQEAVDAVFSRVAFSEIRSSGGGSGLHYLKAEDLHLCRNYIPESLLDVADHAGCSPLVKAICGGNSPKAQLLIEMGASCSQVSSVFQLTAASDDIVHPLAGHLPMLLTPLQAARVMQDRSVAKLLLENDAPDSDVALSVGFQGPAPEDVVQVLRERIWLASKAESQASAILKIPAILHSFTVKEWRYFLTAEELASAIRMLLNSPSEFDEFAGCFVRTVNIQPFCSENA